MICPVRLPHIDVAAVPTNPKRSSDEQRAMAPMSGWAGAVVGIAAGNSARVQRLARLFHARIILQ
jgi:hypothetical protein